jgi:hypothetical protein
VDVGVEGPLPDLEPADVVAIKVEGRWPDTERSWSLRTTKGSSDGDR